MKEPNLLVTYNPSHRELSRDEIQHILIALGHDNDIVDESIDGVFLVATKNPKTVVKKLASHCKKNPALYRYTVRWIPIDSWCSTSMSDIGAQMKEINKKLGTKDTWKLGITKRHYSRQSTADVIGTLTEHITNPNINLLKPRKIVQVEIVGKRTGVALLDESEVFNVNRFK